MCPSASETFTNADAVLLLTEWPEFRTLPWGQLKDRMKQPIIMDGRNILDPKQMRQMGFTYYSVGRP